MIAPPEEVGSGDDDERASSPLDKRYVLRDQFYVGEVVFDGGQAAAIDRHLFDAVQAKLDEQATYVAA